jgi:elongation factor Ts
MEINLKDLKELRERTGAGVLDCKKALAECNSNLEEAVKWLREKGIAKAVKKAGRTSAEGLFEVLVDGNNATLFEINCETDFVAMNAKFKAFQAEVAQVISANHSKNTEEALDTQLPDGAKLADKVLEFSGVIGEKIELRNVKVVTKEDNQVFGVYKHNGGKIAVVTVMDNCDAQVAKAVAMHVCANDPQYIDETYVDEEFLNNEKETLLKEALAENAALPKPKPEAIVEKMVQGRLNKELKEICLVNQALVTDPNTTVGAYLAQNNTKVHSYLRVVVGAGIEKKENDFVNEVMNAVKN